nr:PREDICTED: phosphoribosylformylglycinamidine synthase-like [Bemisia tabaci]
MVMIRYYQFPGLDPKVTAAKLKTLRNQSCLIAGLNTELCFNVEINKVPTEEELKKLRWILSSPFDAAALRAEPTLKGVYLGSSLIEIGPRLNFSTPFSSNAVSICHSIGLTFVTRLEVFTRYLIKWEQDGLDIGNDIVEELTSLLYDRMTQCCYDKPITSFEHGIVPESWFVIDVLNEGRKALEVVNKQLGLAFDEWDLDFYTELFQKKLKRNPTSVECFDLAQSNSEHSRHWFFKGKMIVNRKEKKESLLDMIFKTQECSNQNNVIKFSDNSSAIEGFTVTKFKASSPSKPSILCTEKGKLHLIFTAETHNFPTGVAPFCGATTGTGGRIRDVQAVGRGGYTIAGTAGYSVGNLFIPDYKLPWENKKFAYPKNFASPLDILIEASNGASDYGNKFGEPLISGFTRSFGLADSSGERREWIKPIMFSGGIGTMDENMTEKLPPEPGMQVVKIGGPVYRIGVGGGAASSIEVQGDNKAELDFGAVQRGDPEMEQKMNRVLRACLELPDYNPITSIHDQGAGGNGNVLKELVEPTGAVIFTKKFQLGDPSISTLELWGAEYQENDALLCRPEHVEILRTIGARERCPVNFVGVVTGNGKIILSEDDETNIDAYIKENGNNRELMNPVDLDLDLVLGKMPQKVFHLDLQPVIIKTLNLPANLTVMAALERVLRLPSVCSKRFLTNKVDRCVTGLIAQQQCVGPLHTPLADVAVTAISYFETAGIASAIGEQPIKGLLNAAAGARMTVAESLTNLVFAVISDLADVKCSGNWMWAAKLPGEGAELYSACEAMCEVMRDLGIAVDGGKDSLSMAARVNVETIKAPGTLVVSTYAPCPDIRKKITPDFKLPACNRHGELVLVDLSNGFNRLGGSALAQCYMQLGDSVPDMESPSVFKSAFKTTQSLISEGKVTAGHDVSDGGIVTCLLEMAFAGMCGFSVDLSHKLNEKSSIIDILFAEEIGWVLETDAANLQYVLDAFKTSQVPCYHIGSSAQFGMSSPIQIKIGETIAVKGPLFIFFSLWEETSYRLECRQMNAECAFEEFDSLIHRRAPVYKFSAKPKIPRTLSSTKHKVAVLREEGTNGDREMAAALYMAGLEVWDIHMQDLLDSKIDLDIFRGLIFPGGFSYADVLGSAKGWAASLQLNLFLKEKMDRFYNRKDTFSLGVCNGCQLMCLLNWVGVQNDEKNSPSVILSHNNSGRFECRFSTVKIEKSPSILLNGMEDYVLGVWVAHGEGRFVFRDEHIQSALEKSKCFAIRYVNEQEKPTTKYPLNPNGSPGGLAGICSMDGRHLAMMPHPERCVQMWQWPYVSPNWSLNPPEESPWLQMFRNATAWCEGTKCSES